MKSANARLYLAADGSDVPIYGITPAEALVLGLGHLTNAKKYPVHSLVELEGEENYAAERTPVQEILRLMAKYGQKRVKACYPDAIPRIPETFAQAEEAVMAANEMGGEEPQHATFFGSTEEADAIEKAAAKK